MKATETHKADLTTAHSGAALQLYQSPDGMANGFGMVCET